MQKYLKHLLELTLSPRQGWDDVAGEEPDTRTMELKGLFPWLGIVALSCLMRLLYESHLTAGMMIPRVLITFGMFFAGYYISVIILSYAAEKFMEYNAEADIRIKTLVAYCTGMLALFRLIENVLPSHITLLHFLPFYIGIVMWRSVDYMKIQKDSQGPFLFVSILAVIAPPYMIEFLLNLFA